MASLAVLLFTNRAIYSIITFLAASIGILGFLVMIRQLDRYLAEGRGKWLFFLGAFLKLLVIAVLFYPVSRVSDTAVIFYILGLSVVVIATMIEGARLAVKTFTNGRA